MRPCQGRSHWLENDYMLFAYDLKHASGLRNKVVISQFGRGFEKRKRCEEEAGRRPARRLRQRLFVTRMANLYTHLMSVRQDPVRIDCLNWSHLRDLVYHSLKFQGRKGKIYLVTVEQPIHSHSMPLFPDQKRTEIMLLQSMNDGTRLEEKKRFQVI